jgi:segregation and condensation protein B
LPLGLRPPYAATAAAASTTPVAGSGVRDARMARVEAVLFLAEVPINTRKISQFANLADGTEARTLIRRLNEWYDRRGSAFRAEEVAGGFQLLTRRKFAGWLRRLVRTHVETRLSTSALETLAVAAYRQPVTRAEIESIRGVQCDEMLRQLMERDLLKIVGRSDELGRPFLYGTTRRFLQYFGLRHLDELPRAEVLRAEAVRGDQADIQPEVSPNSSIEESAVKIAADTDLAREEELERRRLPWADDIRAADDDDDDFEDEDEEEDDEEEDDLDDDEDEEEEDFEDEDFDDDWEEVDDEEDDEEEEDEDEDWDDEDEDDDDDWDDDEEEEEEEDDE